MTAMSNATNENVTRAAKAVVDAWDELADMELMKDRELAKFAKIDLGDAIEKLRKALKT
jgi:hypothetical protein